MKNQRTDIDDVTEFIVFSINAPQYRQRKARPHGWFTGEDITTKFKLPERLRMTFLCAFARLPFEKMDINDEAIRCRGVA